MKTYKDYIQRIIESPIALPGNWPEAAVLGSVSKLIIEKDWAFIEEIRGYDLYKHKNSNTWVLGSFKRLEGEDKPRLVIVFEIKFNNLMRYAKKYRLDNLYNVDGVKLIEDLHGRGIGTDMYKYFVKTRKYNMLSDAKQYFGARKLWQKLSKMMDLTVDVIDFNKKIFLERDIVINHGVLDKDFDKNYYSVNSDKSHIRFVLKDIK